MATTPLHPETLDPSAEISFTRPAPDALEQSDAAESPSLFDAAADDDVPAGGGAEHEAADSPEPQLVGLRAELARQQVVAAEWEARCGELERAVARERRAAEHEIEFTTSNLVRAHGIAVADRDRAVAQHREAVAAREAAVRTRQRMEAQRDEAIARAEAAEARRDEATTQRNDARRECDDLLAAYRALQKQLRTAAAAAAPKRAVPPPAADRPPGQAPGQTPRDEADVADTLDEDDFAPSPTPIVVLGRGAPRDSEHGLTDVDRWGIRLLVATGGLCFMALLLVITKALFGL